MSRDRLLKNSWSYSRAGLTKGVPNGLSVTRRDELAVSDVGLTGYGNEIFECYYFGIVSYFYFLPYICQRLTWGICLLYKKKNVISNNCSGKIIPGCIIMPLVF